MVMMREFSQSGALLLARLALTHVCSLQASRARRAWREAQGAVSFSLAECDVKVDDARLDRPRVSLTRLETEASPSRMLVSEMMIMAGQIAAEYGERLLWGNPFTQAAESCRPHGHSSACLQSPQIVQGLCCCRLSFSQMCA